MGCDPLYLFIKYIKRGVQITYVFYQQIKRVYKVCIHAHIVVLLVFFKTFLNTKGPVVTCCVKY